MSPISRGFHRRHQEAEPAGRVPPGQYVTHDFPVLSAGPTPHTPLSDWTFSIEGGQSPAQLDLGGIPGAADTRPSRWTSTA